MSESRLRVSTIKVRDLIKDFNENQLPEFQRGYVWRKGKSPKLIDSIYKKFPISSLLFWSTEEEIHGKNGLRSGVKWLIDGQQRVRTLAECLKGEKINVVFHPDREEFRLANAATAHESNWYRIADIWNDNSYFQIFNKLPNDSKKPTRQARLERVRAILDYDVPLVHMEGHSLKEAVEVFTRINRQGVRLGTAEIERARLAATHAGFVMKKADSFLDYCSQKGFKRLIVVHLFQACEFVACNGQGHRSRLDQLERRELEQAWDKTEKAAREAINLVRSEFGLINMDLLWSGSLLVPVIAFCATRSPCDKDTSSITAWLACAALWHRYSRSANTALEQDLKACSKEDPLDALLVNIKPHSGSLKACPDDFGGDLADKSALLAMFIACHHKGCQDLFSGAKIVQQDNIERHHIFPRSKFSEDRRRAADRLANIAFISGTANKSVGDDDPGRYLLEIDKRILESQCIPADRRLWRIERAEEFWQARRKLLAEAFNDYLRNSLPQRQVRDAV